MVPVKKTNRPLCLFLSILRYIYMIYTLMAYTFASPSTTQSNNMVAITRDISILMQKKIHTTASSKTNLGTRNRIVYLDALRNISKLFFQLHLSSIPKSTCFKGLLRWRCLILCCLTQNSSKLLLKSVYVVYMFLHLLTAKI